VLYLILNFNADLTILFSISLFSSVVTQLFYYCHHNNNETKLFRNEQSINNPKICNSILSIQFLAIEYMAKKSQSIPYVLFYEENFVVIIVTSIPWKKLDSCKQ